ncbi:ribonucleoside-diphosphate reductase subunit alpha [Conexibacter sp. CPCC 206217]|uniref:ribonucleoside-diphosphate reductase subunit alpha n=1 Tax=Conexibacter sp. CPCC 206217 TaxID=3064574 RepID=UPI002725BD17|nr:ribonucleoside-diphosphate reductase subunit alpha [Conexibacter sp. CPCC 206217]
MLIEFDEILRDLELKRAAALPGGEGPALDVAAALAELEHEHEPALAGLTLIGEDGGERPFAPAQAGTVVADALRTLALAGGETAGDTAAARAIVRAVTRQTVTRLAAAASGGARQLTEGDLSTVVEAALIDAGHYEIAKALVLRRAAPSAQAGGGAGARPSTLRLIRRSGHVTAWEPAKIEVAIRKAFLSLQHAPEPAVALAARVSERAQALGMAYVPIESVQDIVQEELVLAGHMRVAERYIVYRAERSLLRAQQAGERGDAATGAAQSHPPVPVVEADDSETLWSGADLRERIAFASIGLDLPLDARELERELRRSIRPGIARADLRRLTILNAKALVERDAEFSRFAGRILLSHVYEEALDWQIERDGIGALKAAHERALPALLERGVAIKRIDARLLAYDVEQLAATLDPTADLDFDFLGLQTLYDRYLLIDKTGRSPRRMETPQLFWLRVAMGVCLGERAEDPVAREQRVIDLYTVYKQRRFSSATPTLFNAGTPHSQLSSCFLYKIDDTLSSIVGRGIAENAMCSKWAGGLGGSWTAVRGTGAHIESTNGESQGVVPFLKMHNDQLVAVNQGGKRAGAGCAYLEVWHNDIREFLELRRNTGDDRRRTHDMSTATWVPDLFMKRVEAREQWTLLRSNDVPDLHETYGAEFERRYEAYEAQVEAGELFGERIPALELWKQMLKLLFETGHPWITFKDPCNVRSPQDHAGVVHSSNLCTEITLNTGPDETAVCNLGSIVVDQHLDAAGELDHEKLRATIRVAVRALDNVIDVNLYPTEPTRTANDRHRPIGLGVMGLQYALYRKGLPFDSPAALDFGDELMEAIAYYAYEASSDLAAERGTYSSYEGSKWDRGMLPQDTLQLLEAERGQPIAVPRGGQLDWAPLRAKIAAQGMRNSNVLAIAPTATIANIMGTSPCIEPIYKNLFAKSNLSGDFVIVNPYLVRDLKAAGLWNGALAERLKAVDGDLEQLPEVPRALRDLYRTAFQIEPERLIDAAARRQKWIDQSQSLNLFLAQPDLKAMSHMYRRAWHAGLKTTYYLRTLGASTIEKATVAAPAYAELPTACSIEAMRNGEECEACQ